jgi:hypothetical protein
MSDVKNHGIFRKEFLICQTESSQAEIELNQSSHDGIFRQESLCESPAPRVQRKQKNKTSASVKRSVTVKGSYLDSNNSPEGPKSISRKKKQIQFISPPKKRGTRLIRGQTMKVSSLLQESPIEASNFIDIGSQIFPSRAKTPNTMKDSSNAEFLHQKNPGHTAPEYGLSPNNQKYDFEY